jgi:DnaD/phage-associated family protein
MTFFKGFAPGSPRTVKLPTAFYSDLLPLVDDLAELKVTLFAFYAIQQREGDYRYLRQEDFAQDAPLLAGLRAAAPYDDALYTLNNALDAACRRGTLLRADLEFDDGRVERLYFINAEPGRRALMQLERGAWRPGTSEPVELLPERPNIFELYERNIGALTPMVVDLLKSAQADYPADWIEDAIRVAVEKNARHWRFIAAVLERRRKEGNTRHETVEKFDPLDGKSYKDRSSFLYSANR